MTVYVCMAIYLMNGSYIAKITASKTVADEFVAESIYEHYYETWTLKDLPNG